MTYPASHQVIRRAGLTAPLARRKKGFVDLISSRFSSHGGRDDGHNAAGVSETLSTAGLRITGVCMNLKHPPSGFGIWLLRGGDCVSVKILVLDGGSQGAYFVLNVTAADCQ